MTWNPPITRLPAIELPEAFDAIASLSLQIQVLVSNAIAHPIWAVVLLLLGIGLLQLLADLIKRLIRLVITTLLRLPLTLSQWIWSRFFQKRAIAVGAPEPPSPAVHTVLTHPKGMNGHDFENAEGLKTADLLAKLNQLRQEQDVVIRLLQQRLSDSDEGTEDLASPSSADPSISKESDTV